MWSAAAGLGYAAVDLGLTPGASARTRARLCGRRGRGLPRAIFARRWWAGPSARSTSAGKAALALVVTPGAEDRRVVANHRRRRHPWHFHHTPPGPVSVFGLVQGSQADPGIANHNTRVISRVHLDETIVATRPDGAESYAAHSRLPSPIARRQQAAIDGSRWRRVRSEHSTAGVEALPHRPARADVAGKRVCAHWVMAVCCARHNFRLRLAPWQPMVHRDELYLYRVL